MTMIANSTSAWFDRATQGMGQLRARANALQQQISSGEKQARSSDDPLASSRLRSLARADTLSRVDNLNSDRASADLRLADSALSSFAEYITRAKELATQAANGTLAPAQRASIGEEMLLIHGNLVTLANTRNVVGQSLFGGEATGDAYTLDASGNAVYTGTASAGELPLGDGQTVKRGLTGPEFLNFGGTDLMAVVKALGEALQGAAADPAGFAARRARFARRRARHGYHRPDPDRLAPRLDRPHRRAPHCHGEMHSGEEAELGATDMAATIANLQQVMLVLEASQASFARLSGLSLFTLLR